MVDGEWGRDHEGVGHVDDVLDVMFRKFIGHDDGIGDGVVVVFRAHGVEEAEVLDLDGCWAEDEGFGFGEGGETAEIDEDLDAVVVNAAREGFGIFLFDIVEEFAVAFDLLLEDIVDVGET